MLHHLSKKTIRILEIEIALSTIILGVGFLTVTSSASAMKYYQTHLFPGSVIHGNQVGSKNASQVFSNFNTAQSPSLPDLAINIHVDDIQTTSSFSQLKVNYNYALAIENQIQKQNQLIWWQQLSNIVFGRFRSTEIPVPLAASNDALEPWLTNFATLVDIEGQEPDVFLEYSNKPNSLVVEAGEPSRFVQIDESKELLNNTIAFAGQDISFSAVVASGAAVLTPKEITQTQDIANQLVGKQIELKHDTTTITVTDQDLIEMISPPNSIDHQVIAELVSSWEEEINRKPIDAQFEYDPDTLEVKKFSPDRVGRELLVEENVQQLTDIIQSFLDNPASIESKNIQLMVKEIAPEISLEETNNLGIKERIGFGESEYDHSIPNRIHNVGITADRISLTIVPPGEEFSFNKTLGDVSSSTGYRPAYVISGGRTILGDGGGVCQVSSTLFRSILDAGLKITRRIPHSYRVSYYELNSQPGFDATVYNGNIDLRFQNDTDHHILIYSKAYSDRKYMFMEIYGTDDGRQVEIANYRKWNSRGPLPAEYYDSTELAPGEIRQIDWAASGISTEFTRVVKDAEGKVIHDDTYTSHFRPWAAKFLRGV